MQFSFGSGFLWASRNDITPVAPVRFGALQDVSVDFDAEIKDLFSQYSMPIDTARGKMKIAGKAKLARISAVEFNSIFFGQTQTTGQTLTAKDEVDTTSAVITGATSAITAAGSPTVTFATTPAGVVIGSVITDTTAPTAITPGTYVISKTGTTVTMSANAIGPGLGSGDTVLFAPALATSNAATYTDDLGVRLVSTGEPLTKVLTAPATGQYMLTFLGSYAFAAADAGLEMYIDYDYTATTGFTVSGINPLMGAAPRWGATFNNVYEGNVITLKLLRCVSTKLSMATKLDDYTIPELDFSAFADSSNRVFEFSTTT